MNPYLIIGALVGFIAVAIGSFTYGQHVENLSWEATVGEQKAQAATLQTRLTAAVSEKDRSNAQHTLELDQEHDAHQKAISAAAADNQRLLAIIDSLRNPVPGHRDSRSVPVSKVSAGSGPTANGSPDSGQPASCQSLLIEGADLLGRISAAADDNAEYDRVAHDFAAEVDKSTSSPTEATNELVQ